MPSSSPWAAGHRLVSPLRSEWSRSMGARPRTSRLPRGRVLRNHPVCNGCNCSREMVVAIPSHPIAGWPHAHATSATHKLPDSGRMARLQAPVVRRAVGPMASRYLRSPKGEIAVTTPMVAGVIREYGDRVSALGQRYSWSYARWLAIALSDGRRAGAASGCGAPALGGSPALCVALCCVGGDGRASRFQLVHRLGIAAGTSLQPTPARSSALA